MIRELRFWLADVWPFLLVVLGIPLLIVGCVAGGLVYDNHTSHVSCLRLAEQTGLPTRYARSGADGECYVYVDGKWIPEDRWRTIEGDN